MSVTLQAAAALGGWRLVERLRPSWPWWAPVSAALAWWSPELSLLVVAVGITVRRIGRRAVRRRRESYLDREIEVLAELMTVGLTAGMTPRDALARAAGAVGGELEREVAAVLRSARTRGLAVALREADGHGSEVCELIAGAVESGAPVRAAVDAFVERARAARRAGELAAARRLPVQLLFPLALGVLPGFMVLTIAPVVFGSLDRLGL